MRLLLYTPIMVSRCSSSFVIRADLGLGRTKTTEPARVPCQVAIFARYTGFPGCLISEFIAKAASKVKETCIGSIPKAPRIESRHSLPEGGPTTDHQYKGSFTSIYSLLNSGNDSMTAEHRQGLSACQHSWWTTQGVRELTTCMCICTTEDTIEAWQRHTARRDVAGVLEGVTH